MRLGREDNGRAPWAATATDPAISKKSVQLVEDDLGFVGAIVGRTAGHRLTGAGIDTEFEATDALGDAGFIESVPVAHDNSGQLATKDLGNRSADAEVLIEFSLVSKGVPNADVRSRGKVANLGDHTESIAVALKDEVAVIEGFIVGFRVGLKFVTRFRAPDFRGAFDAMDGRSSDGKVGGGESGK